jgi:hypothetical protein
MPVPEAGSGAPLFDMQAMRLEDGPPLSVAGYLRGDVQLQSVSTFLDIYIAVLLGGFRCGGDLDLDGGVQ